MRGASARGRLSPWGRHILELVVAEYDTPVLTSVRVAVIAKEYGLDVEMVEHHVDHELVPLGWVRRR